MSFFPYADCIKPDRGGILDISMEISFDPKYPSGRPFMMAASASHHDSTLNTADLARSYGF
jgi:hypothetical protein